MATWTWMRYSYCWDISARVLPSEEVGLDRSPVIYFHDVETNLVLVHPDALQPEWPEAIGDHWLRDRYVRVKGRAGFRSSMSSVQHDDGTMSQRVNRTVWVTDGTGSVRMLISSPLDVPYREGEYATFHGKLIPDVWRWWENLSETSMKPFALDISASRWHAASVGGLVVGAMGLFVFGLYLRSWLRARRQASVPQ